jgi:hypothetical protein
MTVVNFRITKLEGERTDKKAPTVTANASSMITAMKLEKDKNIGDYLLVSYRYIVKYEPDIGHILIEGSLWYMNKDLKKVVNKDKEKVTVEKEVMEEVSTAIIREGLLESIDISRKLQLPPPMNLPKVEVRSKAENKSQAA